MTITLPFSELWFLLVIGVILAFLVWRGILGSTAAAFAGIAALLIVAAPWLLSLRTVKGIHRQAIHGESLTFADAASARLDRVNAPVINAAQNGVIDLAGQRAAMRRRGTVGFEQDQNEQIALAALDGKIIGDIYIHANRDVTSNPITWATPGQKQVCAVTTNNGVTGDWITAWGTANSYRVKGHHLNKEVTPQGWPYEPVLSAPYTKVRPAAPYMALLVQAGLKGQTVWQWEHIGGQFYKVFVPTDSCQELRWAYNDYDKDAQGTHQTDIFLQNSGGAYATLGQQPPQAAATQ
jgi:hypothetical protein